MASISQEDQALLAELRANGLYAEAEDLEAAIFAEVGPEETGDLAVDLQSKMEWLLRDPTMDVAKASKVADWLNQNFHFSVSRTPRGGKDAKERLSKLHWALKFGLKMSPVYSENAVKAWDAIRDDLGLVVRLFTDQGTKVIPRQLRVGQNVYVNEVGLGERELSEYVEGMESVFRELRGWRRKALTGGITVVFGGPSAFSGTAGGVYKSEEDRLYVRATPAVMNRTRGRYGAFDYIIVHEVGHRYERKLRPQIDFDRYEWETTKYSSKDGEKFAELFALTNFGMPVPGKEEVLAKFEKLMSSESARESDPSVVFSPLPAHLRRILGK